MSRGIAQNAVTFNRPPRTLPPRTNAGQTNARIKVPPPPVTGEPTGCRERSEPLSRPTQPTTTRLAAFLNSAVEKHFQEGTVEPQISPLRCASVEMTKGRAVLRGTVVAEQEPISSPWVGRGSMIPLSKNPVQQRLSLEAPPSPLSSRPGAQRSGEICGSAVLSSFLGNVFIFLGGPTGSSGEKCETGPTPLGEPG